MTRRPTHAGLLLLATAAIAVHLPALPYPFEGDDFSCLENAAQALRDPSHFLDWVLGARLRGELGEHDIAGLFRAIPKLVMMFGTWLFGLHPVPFRLLNIALHVAAMILVGRLAGRRFGDSASPAGQNGDAAHRTGDPAPPIGDRVVLMAAGLFGIGLGSYTSGVVHVSNVTVLLATVFLLVAIEAWERAQRYRAVAFFVAALLSHEIAGAALLVLPFLGARSRARRLGRPLLAGALVLLAMAALLLPAGDLRQVARVEIEQSCFLVLPLNPARAETIERAGLGEGTLMGLAVRGADAIARHRLAIGLVLLFASFVASLTAGARTGSGVLFAVAWLYAFFLPVSTLMAFHEEVGPLWESGWMQRRYLYVPGIGAALLAAGGLSRLWRSRRGLAAAIGIVLCLWVLAMDGVAWLGQRSNRAENLRRQVELRQELSHRAAP